MIGDRLTKSDGHELINVLNIYRDVFVKNLGELGCTDLMKMDIPEVVGSISVFMKSYRTSMSEKGLIHGILEDWWEHGIISTLN